MLPLSLTVLGPFQVSRAGQPISGFESNKVRALLAYLAIENVEPHPRSSLCSLLWPDRTDQAARNNLNQALASLRRTIGDRLAQPPYLIVTNETIQFNKASRYDLDLANFAALLEACDRHSHRHPEFCPSCAKRLETAVTFYRGEFLHALSHVNSLLFEEWVLMRRERAQRQALGALYRLTVYYDKLGLHDRALHGALRQLELDPWREEAHRQAMKALAAQGERTSALMQFDRCRRVLSEELRVEPTRETTELYEAICTGQFSPGNRNGLRQRVEPTAMSLIGRDQELADLSAWIETPDCRLITVVGPGGIGKTFLATAAAAGTAVAFEHGAAIIGLEALGSGEWLAAAILRQLGVYELGPTDPEQQLIDVLRNQELLLVLDNFEHLADSQKLLAEIIRQAPRVTLLVTSRMRLSLQAEWVFELTGLAYPKDVSAPDVLQYPSVELFVQRSARSLRGFQAAPQGQFIARICQLVEGLPLAIELAASIASTRSVELVVRELEADVQTLAVHAADMPDRQRSIQACFEHSWRLLAQEERAAARRLSILRGAYNAAMADCVTLSASELLGSLVSKSWLRADGLGHFEMHALVRRYAHHQLVRSGEEAQAQRNRLNFLVSLVSQAEQEAHGPQDKAWLTRLGKAHDNVRAALDWALNAGHVELALQLSAGMGRYWELSGQWKEGRLWLGQVLAADQVKIGLPAQRGWLAQALLYSGILAWRQGDYGFAHEALQQSINHYQALGNDTATAEALDYLGGVFYEQGRYVEAQDVYVTSLDLWRHTENQAGLAGALNNLARVLFSEGNTTTAYRLCRESTALFRTVGDSNGLSYALNLLGNIELVLNGPQAAKPHLDECLVLRRAFHNKRGVAAVLCDLGNINAHQGEVAIAHAQYAESLEHFRELGNVRGILSCLAGWARLGASNGQLDNAVVLLSVVDELLGRMQGRLDEPIQSENAVTVTALRLQLEADRFNRCWRMGKTTTMEDAIAMAQRINRQGD